MRTTAPKKSTTALH